MRSWVARAGISGLLVAAGLAFAQDAPKSILPPGFDEPAPPKRIEPRPEPEPVAEIKAADPRIAAIVREDPLVQRLTSVPGVGPITATAFVATIDTIDRFAGAHQLESYLGLVPTENSSGEKQRKGHITKAGNSRLRYLLVEAA